MKEYLNSTFEFKNLSEEKYNMLIDFLENNNISYEETDYELFTVDERTEDEKYEDWLAEQADNRYDEMRMEEIENGR